MWMKWHHKWAHGSKEWEWKDLDCSPEDAQTCAQEAVETLAEEYNWSDKYRGIDYEIVEFPPPEIVIAYIQKAERLAKYWAAKSKELAVLFVMVS
jgi:hypothetical protein